MKLRGIITAFLLLVPAASFAANKDMEVLQRDVALMQEDIRQLQRSFDQQIGILKTLDPAGRRQHHPHLHLGRRGADRPSPTRSSGRSTRPWRPSPGSTPGSTRSSSQVQTLSDAVQALNSSMQQLHTQLTDLKNVVAAIQVARAPAAAAQHRSQRTDCNRNQQFAAPGPVGSSLRQCPPRHGRRQAGSRAHRVPPVRQVLSGGSRRGQMPVLYRHASTVEERFRGRR